MAALFVTCPVTGMLVDSGIEMDETTFAAIPDLPLSIACPHCGKDHTSWVRSARLMVSRPPPTMWPDVTNENRC